MTPASSSNQDDVDRDRARAIADMHAHWRKLDEERSNPRLALERQITGALKSCIAAHGPITTEYLSSASKRVAGVVLARDDAEIPDPNQRFADRLRIEGDGTYRNTRVLFDGEQLHGVKEITWALLGFELASVTITFLGRPEIDVKP